MMNYSMGCDMVMKMKNLIDVLEQMSSPEKIELTRKEYHTIQERSKKALPSFDFLRDWSLICYIRNNKVYSKSLKPKYTLQKKEWQHNLNLNKSHRIPAYFFEDIPVDALTPLVDAGILNVSWYKQQVATEGVYLFSIPLLNRKIQEIIKEILPQLKSKINEELNRVCYLQTCEAILEDNQ